MISKHSIVLLSLLYLVASLHSLFVSSGSTLTTRPYNIMTKISVHLANNFCPPESASIKHALIITSDPTKNSNLSSRLNVALEKTFEWGGAAKQDWCMQALSTLKPAKECSSTVDFLIPCITPDTEGRPRFFKITVAVLPSICSRGNTPSRAHVVSSLVRSHKGSAGSGTAGNDFMVVLVPEVFEHAYPQACAVGRQFPLFNMKAGAGQKDSSSAGGEASVFIVVDTPPAATASDAVQLPATVQATIDNIRLAQRLVDMPPNMLHVTAYIEEAQAVASLLVAEGHNCAMKVIRGEELRDGGFGGLWGVGKASEHPPALVILSHYPEHLPSGSTPMKGAGESGSAEGDMGPGSICMVGKGIVYDTGGLSIKTPTTSMAGMKVDMGGSAAVLGGFATAVRNAALQPLNAPLHALLCLAENAVDERSTRPDDILTMLSGKTVEVNNVDAEGRLVLGDGCNYATRYLHPAYVVDIATLTGAQMIATGKNHGALYCNDDELEALAVAVGKATGDLTHPMPYAPEFYKAEFASVVADMKNSVKNRGNAQVSCAGQFVGNHIEDYTNNGGKWLHIDMAGCATVDERATGYGVALLAKLVEALNLD